MVSCNTQCRVPPLDLVEGVRTGDRVESAAYEGKARHVRFHQMGVRKAPGLFLAHPQHTVGEIYANNLAITVDLRVQVRQEGSRSCANVENRAAG